MCWGKQTRPKPRVWSSQCFTPILKEEAALLSSKCQLSWTVIYSSSQDFKADARCCIGSFKRKRFPALPLDKQAPFLTPTGNWRLWRSSVLRAHCQHASELQYGVCISHRKPGGLVYTERAVRELQGHATLDNIWGFFMFFCEWKDFVLYHRQGIRGGFLHHIFSQFITKFN